VSVSSLEYSLCQIFDTFCCVWNGDRKIQKIAGMYDQRKKMTHCWCTYIERFNTEAEVMSKGCLGLDGIVLLLQILNGCGNNAHIIFDRLGPILDIANFLQRLVKTFDQVQPLRSLF